MFCSNCGDELNDDVLICPNCGNPTQNFLNQYGDKEKIQKTASDDLAGAHILGILSIVLCFFIPILGYILGGIGYSRANKWTHTEFTVEAKKARLLNIIGLIVTTLVFLTYYFLALSSFKKMGIF